LRGQPLLALRRPPLSTVVAAVGALCGFFVAGYTGVLLEVTNRPIWADTSLLGLLFLGSGASTAAALLLLLGHRRGWAAGGSLQRLVRMDNWLMLLELLVLVGVVLSLGPLARVWLSVWGLALVVGVVLVGILAPLVLHWVPRRREGLAP